MLTITYSKGLEYRFWGCNTLILDYRVGIGYLAGDYPDPICPEHLFYLCRDSLIFNMAILSMRSLCHFSSNSSP